MTEKLTMSWERIYERCGADDAPYNVPIWGIPRGGVNIAQVLADRNECLLVEHPEDADVIVDDIYDSGATSRRLADSLTMVDTPVFWFAFDKREERYRGRWLVMPWELYETERPGSDDVARLLETLGIDLAQDGMKETPERVFRSLSELTSGYQEDPKEILSKGFAAGAYDEMVVVKDIPFFSLCEHHLLPFKGTVTVGYIASGHVVGLSKMARLVHCYARRLQIQERLTAQIAHALREKGYEGVGCVIRASHLCMEMRGIRTPGETVTSCLLGAIREKPEARAEFLDLARQ